MITRPALALADAEAMAAAALSEAEARGWPVCIAICDDGGHLMHFRRMDGAPLYSVPVAMAKARAAALGRRPTKAYEDVMAAGRTAFLTIAEVQAEGFVMLEGGLPVMASGTCVGAIGVSGVQSHEDADIGRAGLATLEDMT